LRAPSALALLREPNYRRVFAASAVSWLGDRMVGVALAFAVLSLTDSPAALGLVLAARTVPLVLLMPAGGVFADRLSRRAVMIAADLVRLGTQGATAALLIAGVAEVWMLAALAALGGAASAFFTPAAMGLLPSVVAPERLQEANGLRGVALSAGEVAGPLLAGALVAGPGPGWALAVDAATFGLSALFLVGLRLPAHVRAAQASFVRELAEGWAAVRSRTWLVALMIAASLVNMLWAAFSVLGPVVAERRLGGAGAWSVIVAALGAGTIAGGVLAVRWSPPRPLVVNAVGVAVFGLPLAALAAGLPTAGIAAATLVGGAALMFGNTLWETTIQRRVPGAVLSRVTAFGEVGAFAAAPIGYAIWGPVGAAVGVSAALWLAFSLQVAVAAGLLAVREIRASPRAPA
jgi:MFS family permease